MVIFPSIDVFYLTYTYNVIWDYQDLLNYRELTVCSITLLLACSKIRFTKQIGHSQRSEYSGTVQFYALKRTGTSHKQKPIKESRMYWGRT